MLPCKLTTHSHVFVVFNVRMSCYFKVLLTPSCVGSNVSQMYEVLSGLFLYSYFLKLYVTYLLESHNLKQTHDHVQGTCTHRLNFYTILSRPVIYFVLCLWYLIHVTSLCRLKSVISMWKSLPGRLNVHRYSE